MTETLEAVFDGTVFRPEREVHLAPNTRVQITIEAAPEPLPDEPVSFLRVAKSLRLQCSKDFSSRIDEYLYGGADLDEE